MNAVFGALLFPTVLSALGKFLETRSELISDLMAFEARLEEILDDEKSGSIQAAIQEISLEMERIDRHVERLIGEPVVK